MEFLFKRGREIGGHLANCIASGMSYARMLKEMQSISWEDRTCDAIG